MAKALTPDKIQDRERAASAQAREEARRIDREVGNDEIQDELRIIENRVEKEMKAILRQHGPNKLSDHKVVEEIRLKKIEQVTRLRQAAKEGSYYIARTDLRKYLQKYIDAMHDIVAMIPLIPAQVPGLEREQVDALRSVCDDIQDEAGEIIRKVAMK